MTSPRIVAAAFGAIAALAIGVLPSSAATPTFAGGPLPPATGTGLTRNEDGEPGLSIDGGGTIWVGSDIAPYAADDPRAKVVLSGEDIWKSTDNGQTFSFVAAPFSPPAGTGTGAGGEDSDIAAAPEKNANGYYNVYAVSLYVANTTLAISQDGGQTWTLDPLSGVPSQDRPWVAADGPCTVYVTYHQLPYFSPVSNKYDLCTPTNSTVGSAINPANNQVFLASTAPGLSNAFGKHVVDTSPTSTFRHNVYVPQMDCYLVGPTDYAANLESTSGCPGKTQVFVGVSTDGGLTFNDYQVAIGTNGEIPVWPDTVATDAKGTVYLAWSDNNHSYLNTSSDGGRTWSASKQIDVAPSLASVYPTVAAGAAGTVEVAWYGTTRAGDSNSTAVMGVPNATGAAPWYVYWARSTDGGASFTQARASDLIHTGALCTQGSTCPSNGSRNLLDDFGLGISPVTGLASIAFTDDQPQGDGPHAFTAYATEVPQPGVGTPEVPLTLLLPLAGGAVIVVGVRRRRRFRG
ncbi:MAG: sialidase family protein [Candidatus Dormibacteria bacterium]